MKTININCKKKRPFDKDNLYVMMHRDSIYTALKLLSDHTFKLWIYLNQFSGVVAHLNPLTVGLNFTEYRSAIDELLMVGYLRKEGETVIFSEDLP